MAANGQVEGSEGEISKVEQLAKTLDTDLENFNEDFDALQTTTESIDNSLRKNNIRLRGLQEGVEGDALTGHLTELFTAWAGSECEIVISIISAYPMGISKEVNKYPRDILIKFYNWIVKSKVLGIFLDQSDVEVGGFKLQIFPDLSTITKI